MLIINTIAEIKQEINALKQTRKSIGFVPTMGALHEGHLSLIKNSKGINDITVCSIYVNPTQFNNKNDFDNYPSTLEKDEKSLKEIGCDILFLPQTEEIYTSKEEKTFRFGQLETVMEGTHRPGHFNGVAQIVSKLFNIVNPDSAFFGQKDYQQLAIIKQLVKDFSFEIEIYSCLTFREKSGLAMSSRNQRLSKSEKIEATKIYESLIGAKELINQKMPVEEVFSEMELFYSNSNLKLEYFEIADSITLQPIKNYNNHNEIVVCVAAFLGNVRLIDNILL